VQWINSISGTELNTNQIIFWWTMIQLVVMVSSKMVTSDMFYALLTFLSGAMMIGSIYFFVDLVLIPSGFSFSASPALNWPLLVIIIIWPVAHLVVSLFNPLVFFMGISTYIFFPTLTFTIQAYSFVNMDDMSWGTR